MTKTGRNTGVTTMIATLGIFALATLALTVVLDIATTEDRDTYEGF